MKIRAILLSGNKYNAAGHIEEIHEVEVFKTATGKFGWAMQKVMDRYLEHLQTGKIAAIEIVKEEGK